MKKILYIVIAVAVLVGVLFLFKGDEEKRDVLGAQSHKEAEYLISGSKVKLENGIAESEAAPGSASKIITRYFGNEVVKDLNGDGRADIVFLLTQEAGGSGIFYYVVAALNMENGYVGSQALFLGDRIALQTTESGEGKIVIVNYADRKTGEDFAVSPSLGKSLWLLLDTNTMQFGEVEQNFEGEADPSKMTLGMKEWTWEKTILDNGTKVLPRTGKIFTITFGAGGKFSAKTDCNSVGGAYKTEGTSITFSETVSTTMYCEGSQESVFTKMLGDSGRYHFTSKGELVLDLKFDSGSVIFR